MGKSEGLAGEGRGRGAQVRIQEMNELRKEIQRWRTPETGGAQRSDLPVCHTVLEGGNSARSWAFTQTFIEPQQCIKHGKGTG